jgi:hypothetical protein
MKRPIAALALLAATLLSSALMVPTVAATVTAAPLHGFSRDTNDELFGYYLPASEIKVGHFQLQAFAVGILDDLKKWEAGRERSAVYAPIMFQFTDLSSKMVKNEESGQMEHAETLRVLPSAYRLKGNTIAFAGSAKGLGTVTFAGKLDIKAIKALNAKNGTENAEAQSPGPVMTGDLTIAGKVYKNVAFSWFAGD